ncbi:highly divergent homeobox isoform X3 [Paramisgurnus dabryanus]|uniref:highly divergent homeobox isoform X3 n=1 Tax=Paramisgurnus dabryanus TaxID=90735 RepID=UPI003CCF3116
MHGEEEYSHYSRREFVEDFAPSVQATYLLCATKDLWEKYSVVVDETTYARDCSVPNIPIGVENQYFLVDVVFMDRCNYSTVSQEILASFHSNALDLNDAWAVVIDNAAYCLKVYRELLKGVMPNRVNVTCLCHIIKMMNLRSVFTAEQQRILERYYENGMTNQSKSCFQLILQCAQDTKLDFSVVRTWVGNKRRKLASQADGVAGQSLFSHHSLPEAVCVTGSVSTGEMAATQSNHQSLSMSQFVPSQASCSSASSSPLSFSPLSTGSGYQADIILTGISSLTRNANQLDASAPNRTGMQALPLQTEINLPPHSCTTVHTDHTVHLVTSAAMKRKTPITPSSSNLKCNQILKQFTTTDRISRNLAKQQSILPSSTWAHSFPSKTTIDNSTQIQKCFSLEGSGEALQLPLTKTSPDKERIRERMVDMSEIFSIAMETGDADDEYLREEELANMGAQMQFSKGSSCNVSLVRGGCSSISCGSSLIDSPRLSERCQSPTIVKASTCAHFGEKGCQINSSSIDTSPPSNFPLRLLSPPSSRISSFKVSSNMSTPWLYSNSRKRTLQDRTQFSDRDLYALKMYWDNGMTSLGLVCKEKISAAANELSVDTEIVKTWIGNRRRKYRLMGIEIPPPKGGPAVFSNQAEAYSPQTLEDELGIPELADGRVSLCLSDGGRIFHAIDGASDFYHLNEGTDRSSPDKNVKIEIIEEENDGDMLTTEMEQMQNFLEFKNEEVQFLEDELQKQKQKFSQLESFTRSLLIAVKNNDQEKQQELLHEVHEDLGMDNHREHYTEAISIQRVSLNFDKNDTRPLKL